MIVYININSAIKWSVLIRHLIWIYMSNLQPLEPSIGTPQKRVKLN